MVGQNQMSGSFRDFLLAIQRLVSLIGGCNTHEPKEVTVALVIN